MRFAALAALALALLLASFTLNARPVEAQGWTCTYDFSTGDQGWTSTANMYASYSSGAWRHNDRSADGNYRRGLFITLTFSSTTITTVTVNGTFTDGSHVAGGHHVGGIKLGAAWPVTTYRPSVPSMPYTYSGTSAGVTSASVYLVSSTQNSATYSGNIAITSIELQGTGTQPSNCPGSATATPTVTPSPTMTSTPTPTNLTLGTPIDITYIAGLGVDGATVGTEPIGGNVYGSNWNNHDGPTSYTVPGGAYLVGWLTRVLSVDSTFSGDGNFYADLRALAGNAGSDWTYAAVVSSNGVIQQNYTCVTANNVPGGYVPGYPNNATACAAWPTYSRTTTTDVYGEPESLVTLGGWAQNANDANRGAEVHFEAIPILYVFTDPPTVDLTCPTGDLTEGYSYELEATTTGDIDSWEWDFGDGNTSTEADGTVEFGWPVPGTYEVSVTVENVMGTATDTCTIEILRIGDPGGGGGALYRPLLTSETDEEYDWTGTFPGLFSAAAAWGGAPLFGGTIANLGPDDETVIGVSIVESTKVYAVADGTVLAIDALTAFECDPVQADGSAAYTAGGECTFSLYDEALSGELAPFASLLVNPGGMYRVSVSYIEGETIEYFVADAPTYVREGQELLAGCIVGTTQPFTLGSQPTNQGIDTRGVFWLERLQGTTQVPILAQLYHDPDPSTACNAGGEYADCLFDPLFQDQGAYQWDIVGNVSRADGFTLSPGSSISLNGLNLDAATAYSFTVWTETPSTYGPTDARMTLGIGTTETSWFLDEHIRTARTIASATHTADEGGLYSIRIINSGHAPFTVLQNCVTAGEPNTTPGSCYFQNFSFDGQLTNWSTTGTVIPDPSGPVTGQLAVMSDLATLGQNVKLYADGGGGDHEYTVHLEGVLHAGANSQIQVRYRIGGGGWILPDVNGWTLSQQSLTALQRTYVLEFDVPSGTVTGLMEFQFDFTATGGDVIGTSLWLSVYSLCLQDAGGWADFPGGGGSGWTPGTGCDNSAPPVELQDDFGAWISYHLNGMEDIYYCDVIPQLEQLNNVTYSIYEYAQWTGLYTQASTGQAWTWLGNSMFPWLGGHLSNIALAAGGAVGVDVGGGCHDIFCLLDAVIQSVLGPIINLVNRIVDIILGLVNTAIDVLLPLVEALIGFFVMLIHSITGILGWLINLITAFVTGIANAQPAPVPGLPNCAIDPSSNGLCAVMYGLEHTVFADEGAAIIPLFIAILSIVQLQWLIGKITELIREVTGGI